MEILNLPVGLDATGTRTESDAMGEVEVPADRYWGAQTQRSLIHFAIGEDRMPAAVYHALGHVKKAAAIVNRRAGRLEDWQARLIEQVSDEVIAGELDGHFPLYVWQTGSGTQSNMNANEVISNRAIQLVGGELGSKSPIHPNDHVNMGQILQRHLPDGDAHRRRPGRPRSRCCRRASRRCGPAIAAKAEAWRDVVKIGRTHLQDAVPLTVGQEWSGYAHQLGQAIEHLGTSSQGLYELAAGRHRGGHRTQRPARVRRADRRADLRRRPATPSAPRPTSSPRSPASTRWSAPPPGCARWPWC